MGRFARFLWQAIGVGHRLSALKTDCQHFTAASFFHWKQKHLAGVAVMDKPKVELHVHLDGALRPATIWKLAKRRQIDLPAVSIEELRDQMHIRVDGNQNLTDFLSKFAVFLPVIVGDEEAIEEMAYDFCENCHENNVIYAEARFNPHFLAKENSDLTPHRVVEVVLQGLQRGMQMYPDVKVRSILCCMRHVPGWSSEILQLCKDFRDKGVVGIDLAGDENLTKQQGGHSKPEHVEVFKQAYELGIHRTCHAGENGTAENVREAVYDMHVERVGHGYHVLDDLDLYKKLLEAGIHFEVCPYSSYTTSSVHCDFEDHPIVRFAHDGANYSINTDDPLLCLPGLREEYKFVMNKIKLTARDIAQANLNAAQSTFLPDEEKAVLVETIRKAYAEELEDSETGKRRQC